MRPRIKKPENVQTRNRATEVVVFWDVTPCSLVWRYQCFGRTDCLHLQNRIALPHWC